MRLFLCALLVAAPPVGSISFAQDIAFDHRRVEPHTADAYWSNPYASIPPFSAPAFDQQSITLAPLFSLRSASEIEMLPRPANPRDILRGDPVETSNTIAAGTYQGGDIAVLQLQGTDVAIDLDVQANLDMAYDSGYTGKIAFSPSDVALDGTAAAHRRGNFLMSARTSVVTLDIQTPKATVPGQLYSEFDFAQSDSVFIEGNDVRLRHLYGRIGGRQLHLIGGQLWTVFGDQYARPISLVTTYAPAAMIVSSPLQLRLTSESSDSGFNTALAIEAPVNSDFVLIDPATDTRLQRWPTLVGRLRYDRLEFIEFCQIAGLLRGIGLEAGDGEEDQVLGWGVSAIISRPVFSADRLLAGAVIGQGLGDYLYGFGGQMGAAGPAGGDLVALDNAGFYVGYIHKWSETVATHAAYGFASAETMPSLPPTSPERCQNAWINIVWQASRNVAWGIEYSFTDRETNDGTTGDNHRIQFSISVAPQASRSDVSAFGRL